MKLWSAVQQFTTLMAGTAWLIASVSLSPALGADPFRTGGTARPISTETEAAFTTVFQLGNYVEAKEDIAKAIEADPKEPLVYTLAAGMAVLEQDWAGLNRYAVQTIQMAQNLMPTDPLRGNLYQAVGTFLLAAYDVSSAGGGVVLGAPQALIKVQQMFQFLDRAKTIDANDPELNLIQGYLEWGLSSNLGLYSPEQAIQRLSSHAEPDYLTFRGLALVYRDLNRPDQALEAVNLALKAAPDNPELFYLKAQILRKKKNYDQALRLFDRALEKQEQLPADVVKQINRERRQVQAALTR